jgi:PHD/YefM family antitoxin component YafN of YafNO toxin-antitoxin module
MDNYKNLPTKETLQKICKAVSVLDAIICQDWQYRYYSYNSQWGDGEEFFEMRNGEGEHVLILFRKEGCVINGVHSEYKPDDKSLLTNGLPDIFHEFIFGEPVASRGTNFCIWTDISGNWQFNDTKTENGTEELLAIFDNNPETYVTWAEEYFEDSCKEDGISLENVRKLYNGEPLTKDIILSVVDNLEDWEQLKEDLEEIAYPFDF